MEEKQVRVKVISQMITLVGDGQNDDGDKTEYSTDGILRDTGKTLELSYPECEDMGFSPDTRTVLLFEKRFPLKINLTRSGENSAGLAFDPENRRQPCAVSFSGMTMEFCVLTKNVVNALSMDGGYIDLDYILEFHGCQAERNIIRIEAKPKRVEDRF